MFQRNTSWVEKIQKDGKCSGETLRAFFQMDVSTIRSYGTFINLTFSVATHEMSLRDIFHCKMVIIQSRKKVADNTNSLRELRFYHHLNIFDGSVRKLLYIIFYLSSLNCLCIFLSMQYKPEYP